MIGNDVVDLNLAKTQSNWERKGFLDKIFTKKEQEFIFDTKSSFEMVWLLWSMKESAYKIYFKKHSVRFFAPKKFECDIHSSQNTVKIDDIVYYTTSTISNDSIHTIAKLAPTKSIITDCFKLENDSYEFQHKTTYNYLKKEVAKQFKIPITQLKIEKDSNGIPHINCLNVTSSLSTSLKTRSIERSSISISHHGVFGAYVFVI